MSGDGGRDGKADGEPTEEVESSSGISNVDSFLLEIARASNVSPRAQSHGGPLGLGAPPEENDLVGRRLLHFHVVARIGAGGMGVVYKAIDEKLRRPVALKVLSARLVADARHRDLLLREARSAAAFNHPNIGSIFEVHESSDGAFLVMELVDGETLRARIAREGALPIGEALRIGLEVARGLELPHASAVVHRDLKCENVMLTPDGRVKLLDFGIATVLGAESPAVAKESGPREPGAHAVSALAPTIPATKTPTTGGEIVGTPACMAPEQAHGESVDTRADVYAFGVLLYEMLAGEHPFPHRRGAPWRWGDESAEAWKARKPLRRAAPRVPPSVERLVSQCLAYHPKERPADGAALVRLVGDCARSFRGRRGWPAFAVVAAVLALALCTAWLLVERARKSPAALAVANASAVPPVASVPPAPRPRRIWSGQNPASTDGIRLAFVENGAVHLQEIATGAERVVPMQRRVPPNATAVVLGPNRLLIAGPNTLWSVDPANGQAIDFPTDWTHIDITYDGKLGLTQLVQNGKSQIRLMDLRDGHEQPIAESDGLGPVHISTDGHLLGWLDPSHVVVARAAAPIEPHVVLEDDRLDLTGFDSNALEWAAPDRLIVAMREGHSISSNLWELRLDSSGERRLGEPRQLTHWDGLTVLAVRVVGDGSSVAVQALTVQFRAMVADVDPKTHVLSNVRSLTRSLARERIGGWTPDGSSVLYTSDVAGDWGAYSRRPEPDAVEHLLVGREAPATWPQVSPDGHTLLYWAYPEQGGKPPPHLMAMQLDGPAGSLPRDLFTSATMSTRTSGAPLPARAQFRCPMRGARCVVLDKDGPHHWYSLDATAGMLEPLEGLPEKVDSSWDVSPDGRTLWFVEVRATPPRATEVVDVYSLEKPCRLLRTLGDPVRDRPPGILPLWQGGFAIDADGKGMFIGGIGAILYRPGTGGEVKVWTNDASTWIGSLFLSPDGRHLAFTARTQRDDLSLADDVLERH